jgi:hypothetical protein
MPGASPVPIQKVTHMEKAAFIEAVNSGKTLINRNINATIVYKKLSISSEIVSTFDDIEESDFEYLVSLRFLNTYIMALSTKNWEVKE